MIGGRRPLQGRKLADRRVRVERPHSPYFRYTGQGQLVAKEAASVPDDRRRAIHRLGRGRPLRSPAVQRGGDRRAPEQAKALAIFSSDAISSSAYATEEILRVLVLAGASADPALPPGRDRHLRAARGRLDLLPAGLPGIPERRRRVRRGEDNLAPIFGLIAASALLIDYVMTVSVSTASAIDQIHSVIPQAYDVRIEIAFISIIAHHDRQPAGAARVREHLRGPDLPVRRPGPGHRGVGLVGIVTGTAHAVPPAAGRGPFGTEALGALLLLKAFAGGSVALTGVEAIANGVPAFEPPEAKNAANTLTAMSILLGILFIGLTLFAVQYGLRPTEPGGKSLVALAAATAFGDGSVCT